MTEFKISLTDRGKKGDITEYLAEILDKCRNLEGEKLISFEKGEYHFYAEKCKKHIIYASNTDSGCTRVHSNIIIESNEFYLEHEKAVFGKYTENLVIRDNRIHIAPDEEPFELVDCNKMLIENNNIV